MSRKVIVSNPVNGDTRTFTRQDVKGDGNCLFRSVGAVIGTRWGLSGTALAIELRRRAAEVVTDAALVPDLFVEMAIESIHIGGRVATTHDLAALKEAERVDVADTASAPADSDIERIMRATFTTTRREVLRGMVGRDRRWGTEFEARLLSIVLDREMFLCRYIRPDDTSAAVAENHFPRPDPNRAGELRPLEPIFLLRTGGNRQGEENHFQALLPNDPVDLTTGVQRRLDALESKLRKCRRSLQDVINDPARAAGHARAPTAMPPVVPHAAGRADNAAWWLLPDGMGAEHHHSYHRHAPGEAAHLDINTSAGSRGTPGKRPRGD
jgi:hypothetical protein